MRTEDNRVKLLLKVPPIIMRNQCDIIGEVGKVQNNFSYLHHDASKTISFKIQIVLPWVLIHLDRLRLEREIYV